METGLHNLKTILSIIFLSTKLLLPNVNTFRIMNTTILFHRNDKIKKKMKALMART